MAQKKSKMRVYTLAELEDEFIGKHGTAARNQYEFELSLARVGDAIRHIRHQRKLTQEQLGTLVGVQKAQISKLEKNDRNVTLETVFKVFMAMKATVSFNVHLNKTRARLA